MKHWFLLLLSSISTVIHGQVITEQKWKPDKILILLQITSKTEGLQGHYLKKHTDTSLAITDQSIFMGLQ